MSGSELRDRLQAALGGTYTLERELGGGGMSRVFVATETALGRKVVVKVLPPEMAAGVNVDRFRREIQLAASLQHPHIVPLHAAGSSGDLLYFTMPLIDGESLRARVARDGELPIHSAVRILRDVADALSYAHGRGVVHRDIKPDNVLISGQHALVTDFGVAKALESSTGEASLTSLGVALGTPAYMAPEQAAAEPHIDHRADIYAFGCLAYEVLTGRPPFGGMSAQQVLAAHITQQPDPLTSRRAACPPALVALVGRCLEKKPADRPQSAGEVHEQLELIATPSGGSAPTTAVATMVSRRPVRRWLILAAGIAGLVLLAGAGYWQLGHRALPDHHRVLSPTFSNKTGDPGFDPLAANVTAAVSRGLSEIEDVEIVDGPGSRAAAGTMVAGALYRQADSIQLSATIVDAHSGKTYYTVGPFAAAVSAPSSAIEPLVQRIAGGVALLLDPTWGVPGALPTQAPRWDAYQQYRLGDVAYYREDTDSALHFFAQAATLDGTFRLAPLRAANTLINGGPRFVARADSAIAAADRLRPRLTPFETQYLNTLRGWSRGDWESARTAALELTRIAPASGFVWYVRGAYANLTRRWHEAVRVLEKVDPSSASLRVRPAYWFHLTNSLHMLSQHKRELAAARRARAQFPDMLYVRELEIRALAALPPGGDLETALSDCLLLPGDQSWSPGDVLLTAVRELRAHGNPDASAATLQRLVDWLATRPTDDSKRESIRSLRVSVLTLAGHWTEAAATADSLNAEHPDDPTYLGMRGLVAARRGERVQAEQASAQLAAPSSTSRGRSTYARAEIAAVLGEKTKAIGLLRDAVAQGSTSVAYLDADPDLDSLRELPEYRALVAPRD